MNSDPPEWATRLKRLSDDVKCRHLHDGVPEKRFKRDITYFNSREN